MSNGIVLAMFVGVGGLFCALGIPLILGRVKPNRLYGLRIQATLDNEKVWYPANRQSGKDLLNLGLFLIVASVALYFVPWPTQVGTAFYALVLSALASLGCIGLCVRGLTHARQLAASQRDTDN